MQRDARSEDLKAPKQQEIQITAPAGSLRLIPISSMLRQVVVACIACSGRPVRVARTAFSAVEAHRS